MTQPQASSWLAGRLRGVAGFAVSLLATVFGLLLVTFIIGRVVPIDPVLAIVGDRATQAQIEEARQALGLDQIPESLLPLLAVRDPLGLGLGVIAVLVALFLVLELVLSRLLYAWHIREHPW